MKTVYLAITALALLLPAQALAGGSSQSAAAVCRSQQAQLGTATFHATYGSFGSCVAHQQVVQAQARQEALDQCKTERDDPGFALAHGGKTFDQYYGGTSHGTNALQACVAAKLPALIAAASERTMNAAQLCRAQRTAMGGKDFALLYGAGPRHANAFGRCVSRLERAAQADEDNAAEACKAEQSDPTFPVNHGGKTFAEWYGRNADKSDAFGNCVSEKAQAAAAARQQATLNAAQSCKGERASSPAAFRAKYGKNTTKSGAFARCVAANKG
jgi:hypothetical protein